MIYIIHRKSPITYTLLELISRFSNSIATLDIRIISKPNAHLYTRTKLEDMYEKRNHLQEQLK